jgi:hypothetical protein
MNYDGGQRQRIMQKIFRIMMGVRDRESCRKYFRVLSILTLKLQYIFSLSLFVINIRHHFEANFQIHNVNTRTKHDLHHPLSQLSVFQNGDYYAEWHTCLNTSAIPNTKQFKLKLKNFLLHHSFYTLDECFNYKNSSFQCFRCLLLC